MKPLSVLILAFLLVPIAEIYLLINIGQVIGAGWTIAGVVSTAVIGAFLVKIQGVITFRRAADQVKRGEAPALELVEGLFLLVAGALLITPGFVTDAVGFACLTPALRRALARMLLVRFLDSVIQRNQAARQAAERGDRTFDADYKELR